MNNKVKLLKNYPNIKIYLVGGGVRDSVMKHPIADYDYVVVGATPEIMLNEDFQQVGADFPIFIDENGHEFALARTERKSGSGYHGFDVDFNPHVTLKEDLERRDLTINCLAEEVLGWSSEGFPILDNHVIDYFGGIDDINNKTLRHVSDAFSEDPLRVLRVCRFAARYEGFTIANETKELMCNIVENNELQHLATERVWQETYKAMTEPFRDRYFRTMKEIGAIDVVIPELSDHLTEENLRLIEDVPERTPEVIASLLTADFGSKQHVMDFWKKICAPNEISEFASKFWVVWNTFEREYTAEHILDVIKQIDGIRKPEEAQLAASVLVYKCPIDGLYESFDYTHDLCDSIAIANNTSFSDLAEGQQVLLKGPEIGQAINQRRLEKIRFYLFAKQ